MPHAARFPFMRVSSLDSTFESRLAFGIHDHSRLVGQPEVVNCDPTIDREKGIVHPNDLALSNQGQPIVVLVESESRDDNFRPGQNEGD